MSDFQRCTICREYGWLGGSSLLRHTCKPSWECRAEWHGDDDWETCHAKNAGAAAAKFAESYDCDGGEYAIIGNKIRGDVIVLVRKPGEEAFERYAIEGEAVPTYHATKVDEPAAGGVAAA